jgi:hypothetical protein
LNQENNKNAREGWKATGREREKADRLRRIHKYAVDWKEKIGTGLS